MNERGRVVGGRGVVERIGLGLGVNFIPPHTRALLLNWELSMLTYVK